jgi:hypothetical protein
MRAVEVSKVGSVKWLSGTDSGWEKGNVFRVILELGTGGGVPFTKKVGAVSEGLGDNVRSAKTVRELGHAIDVTLNLDADHNKVFDSEQRLAAGFVGAFAVVGAAFIGEDSKNFGGESGVRLGEAEEIMDSRDRPVNKGWGVREAVGEARGVGWAAVELREEKVGENLRGYFCSKEEGTGCLKLVAEDGER